MASKDKDEKAPAPAPEDKAADPASKSVKPQPVTTTEELGIGALDPYPTGGKPAERDVYGNLVERDADAGTSTKP